jgi:hypothetical protein
MIQPPRFHLDENNHSSSPGPLVRSDRKFPRDRTLAFQFAIAAAFSFATAALGYAWVRAIETVLFPQADPRAIVAVTESGYRARCALAAFVGGMGGFVGWALAGSPERAGRALRLVILVAALGIALQAGFSP